MSITIVLYNAITYARQEVEVNPGMTVREIVDSSGFIATDSQFSVRDSDGIIVDDCPAVDFVSSTLSVGPPEDIPRGGLGWITFEEIAAGFFALKLLGPFAEAFASKLGERLGESAAAAASRIRLVRRNVSSTKEELVVRQGTTQTIIVVSRTLTDEARLALIDLDVTADGIRGMTLQWDAESKTWRPAADRT